MFKIKGQNLNDLLLVEESRDAIENWKLDRSPAAAAVLVACWIRAKTRQQIPTAATFAAAAEGKSLHDMQPLDIEADLDAIIDDPGLAEAAEMSTERGICPTLDTYNKFTLTALEAAELRDTASRAYHVVLGLYTLGRRVSAIYLRQLKWAGEILEAHEVSKQ